MTEAFTLSGAALAAPPRPQALAGFEGVQRFWDPTCERWTAKVLPGEYYVTRSAEIVSTVLGSCISACIRDPSVGVGGMNHFLLPSGKGSRYGDEAMPLLIEELGREFPVLRRPESP